MIKVKFANHSQADPYILVVDSQDFYKDYIKTLLEQEGFRVHTSPSGEDAINIVNKQEFMIIVINVVMVRVDGIEFASQIRKSKKNAETPIIFMSGLQTDPIYILEMFNSGCVEFISKPFIPQMFLAKVKIFYDLYSNTKSLESLLIQLEQTQEKIIEQKKIESIKLLAGGIAHEFNNLLCSVMNNINFIQEDYSSDSKLFQRCDSMMNVCQRGVVLSERLISFSGHLPIKIKSVSIPRILSDIYSYYKRDQNFLISLTLENEESEFDTQGDETQIFNAINEIVENAAYSAGKQGTCSIKSHLLKSTSEIPNLDNFKPLQNYLLIEIKDNGTGIQKDHIDKIFDPFFTTKTLGEGEGLGLSMTKGIIEKIGGFIFIDSEPGKGSVFRIVLPRSIEQASLCGNNLINSLEEPSDKNLNLKNRKFLIVDDAEIIREIIQEILEQNDGSVTTAQNGHQAIEILAKHRDDPFDLIFLDQVMPNLSGAEVCHYIENSGGAKKIVFVTGAGDLDFYQPFKKNPDIKILKKPFSGSKILDSLKDWLD